MLQPGFTLKTLSQVEEGIQKRLHIVQFHLYKMSRVGKSIGKERRFMARGRRMGFKCLMGLGISFGVMKKL